MDTISLQKMRCRVLLLRCTYNTTIFLRDWLACFSIDRAGVHYMIETEK